MEAGEISAKYLMEGKRKFGKFAILSNIRAEMKEIYEPYKSREEVEQVFDAIKNELESGKSYPRSNEKVKGFFIVFLALRIRFKILKVLKDHNLLGKMSVNEIIF